MVKSFLLKKLLDLPQLQASSIYTNSLYFLQQRLRKTFPEAQIEKCVGNWTAMKPDLIWHKPFKSMVLGDRFWSRSGLGIYNIDNKQSIDLANHKIAFIAPKVKSIGFGIELFSLSF